MSNTASISGTALFLKDRKIKPSGEFQEESTAVFFFKSYGWKSREKANKMTSETQFIVDTYLR